MKIVHDSPQGALDSPLLGRAGIEPGQVIETTAAIGRQLIEQQPYHQWSEVKPRSRKGQGSASDTDTDGGE